MKKKTLNDQPAKVLAGINIPEKEHSAIPIALLKQINEFSNGSYYLFSLSKKGLPIINCRADNPAYGDALKKFCISYFQSIAKAEKKIMENAILHDMISGINHRPGGPEDQDESEAVAA